MPSSQNRELNSGGDVFVAAVLSKEEPRAEPATFFSSRKLLRWTCLLLLLLLSLLLMISMLLSREEDLSALLNAGNAINKTVQQSSARATARAVTPLILFADADDAAALLQVRRFFFKRERKILSSIETKDYENHALPFFLEAAE
jgi:hypothetical protein